MHGSDNKSYEAKVWAEKSFYRSCEEVHRLPEIFHYWSNRYMRPELLRFGFGSPNEMFRKFLGEQLDGQTRERRFVSLGAGNCDLEIQHALQLRAQTGVPFLVDCLELNPAMLERGRAAAEAAGIANQFTFVETDLNSWRAEHEYDAVVVNQCLHHIVNIEGLFAEVKRCLRPSGSFVVSDMIGRNGHQRWPEALEVVHEFWRRLPPAYRFNRLLGRYEELYEDWDCSAEGFEGIRSQEILPLLREQFQFRLFLAFGNAIDPFIDRAFGPNFDAAAEWDRNFIDQIHLRDEQELQSGRAETDADAGSAGKRNQWRPVCVPRESDTGVLRSRPGSRGRGQPVRARIAGALRFGRMAARRTRAVGLCLSEAAGLRQRDPTTDNLGDAAREGAHGQDKMGAGTEQGVGGDDRMGLLDRGAVERTSRA